MKRLLLAGLLAVPVALSRSGARADQDDAYGSLIGMAGSAASDRGPEAGGIPPDNPSMEQGPASPAPSAEAPAAAAAPAPAAKPAPAPSARREAVESDDAPSVAVPAATAPRVWTKVFSTLLPPMARAAAFEVEASTSAGARAAAAASAAGSAQGLLELVAAATAPSSPGR